MGAISGVANLLPTSVITRAARAQAGKIDFATSNLRGAPFPLYVSGARVVSLVTMGPVAGTACNATGEETAKARIIDYQPPKAREHPSGRSAR